MRQPLALLLLALLLGLPRAGLAFHIDTSATHACHEEISVEAQARAGWPGGQAPPALTEQDRRASRDLPTRVPTPDPWTLALVAGVRSNDLEGSAPTDLPSLAIAHNRPELQRRHCLRAPEDDGPGGDASALAACRAFILDEAAQALGGAAEPDLQRREVVELVLVFRGYVPVPMTSYFFHAGRAAHALQDSFSHAFRAPADGRIRHVLNFTDWVSDHDYAEARDGHAHLGELDVCEGPEAAARREAATAATAELFAALAGGGDQVARLAAVGAVLDRRLARQGGCAPENGYCGAPELLLANGGCSAAGGAPAGFPGWFALLALAALGRRRMAAAALVPLLVLCAAAPARADEGPAAAGPTAAPAPAGRFGLNVAIAGSADRGSLSAIVGARFLARPSLIVGVDASWNAWLSGTPVRAAPGVLNIYALAIYRWATYRDVELRTTLGLGISVLLFDLVAADAGTTGLYFGAVPLGVAFPLRRGLRLVLDPAGIAVPIPQLRGVPFVVTQYQVSIGLQWMP